MTSIPNILKHLNEAKRGFEDFNTMLLLKGLNAAIKEIEEEDTAAPHQDDIAVDRFAAAMKAKLAQKREEGRGGWEDTELLSPQRLLNMLWHHMLKGDPVDVANLCMMVSLRGGQIFEPLAGLEQRR